MTPKQAAAYLRQIASMLDCMPEMQTFQGSGEWTRPNGGGSYGPGQAQGGGGGSYGPGQAQGGGGGGSYGPGQGQGGGGGLTKPVASGDPRQSDMLGDDKTFQDCNSKFDNIINFRGAPQFLDLIPPDEEPIQFEKNCLVFCGDACDCGKREFMDSYFAPYIGEAIDEIASSFRDEPSPQE